VAARPRFRDPDGVLRVRWFAGALLVFWLVCLGVAAIGGWAGIVLVALAQVAAVAVIIVSADPGRGEGEGRAG
jgi:hypothetical protein